ncbi:MULTISPECIES: MgtC/SapB family protein [Streptomyces]|uniref:MgtC/SapB family protein n=1 Tax=Streptomyces halstedii TaxID=1944 RepID=A0A6N9U1S7_STRHA|nr:MULTISPECIES: MgtC/SapB family protein [Streptomyces]AWL42053.1 MgtC/SapB family protein [Streptomyces sp. SM18]MBV7672572.1 MgtC/SapB family protein [Streptomyces halstedii]MCW8215556.1 MgtC/SapB family protein [Streptomyces griseolus]NEA17701.1 MgtC/SapB family protein [Streptomyces halstedii]
MALDINEPFGQNWTHAAQFGIAFALSCAIGLEREIRQKAAGLRTYTIVGLGAALFTLVSKYGFSDVLLEGRVVLDPSRVAAQIVSGLGFIGGGVIFVYRGSVRGLTTAASIWLTAAVGAAAGAGLPVLATLATLSYFLVSYGVRPLAHMLPALRTVAIGYRITYTEGMGTLRELVNHCTDGGFSISELTTLTPQGTGVFRRRRPEERQSVEQTVEIALNVQGRGDVDALTARLAGTSGVLACSRSDLADE